MIPFKRAPDRGRDVTTESRKPTRRRSGGRRRRKPREAPPSPEPIAPEPAPPEAAPAPSADLLPLAEPELAFAGRAAARPPEPERPLPVTRRAIFFDVENSSRVHHISRVIDHLAVDRLGRRTDFIAVGNWRVIGHDTARLLASHGAQLLHSAPSVGVKDWSDLRIAVAAGVWLGTARPGDVLEIITDDRAFDAVGDVATSLGITFRRLSYRRLTGLPAPVIPAEEASIPASAEPRAEARGGRRRRGRRGGQRREAPPPPPHHVIAAPPPARPGAEEPHTAPHDELLGVARDLIERSATRMVTLDALANALKARGFSRPPGSPRLITRLRRIKEINLSRSGVITLYGAGHPAAGHPGAAHPAAGHPAADAGEPDVEAAAAVESEAEADVEIGPVRADVEAGEPEGETGRPKAAVRSAASSEEEDEGPGPGNEAVRQPPSRGAPPSQRRRSRRGGRGRRRYPETARAS